MRKNKQLSSQNKKMKQSEEMDIKDLDDIEN